MLSARLNARGDIAAPGAASIASRTILLRQPGALAIDVAGFAGVSPVASSAVEGDGAHSDGWAGSVWRLDVTGAAEIRFTTATGREWRGRVGIAG
jgi:hypothetical protein